MAAKEAAMRKKSNIKLPTGRANEYEATISCTEVDPHSDLMYRFEVMDNIGNGIIYPNMDKVTSYTIVPIKEASAAQASRVRSHASGHKCNPARHRSPKAP